LITKDFIGTLFPFSGIDATSLERIIDSLSYTERDFKRGERVFDASDTPAVGFIVEGECEVRQTKHDGSPVSLNRLVRGQSFGILSVFGKAEFPTELYAKRNSTVMFICGEDFISLIHAYPEVSYRVIAFLAGKVSFLNRKIRTMSGTRVEDRLASFILLEAEKFGNEIPFNCKKTAEAINSGRSSVYRALDSLSSLGLITFDTKTVKITDLEGLSTL
jgi:CRP/FNR family transcriptional regulator